MFKFLPSFQASSEQPAGLGAQAVGAIRLPSLLLSFLLGSQAIGQEPLRAIENRFTSMRFEMPVSSEFGTVLRFLEDGTGVLWAITRRQLLRCDGVEWETVRSVDEVKDSMGVNALFDIDDDGMLWMSGGNEFRRYDPKHDNLTRFIQLPSDIENYYKIYNSLVVVGDEIWLSSLSGLIRYSRSAKDQVAEPLPGVPKFNNDGGTGVKQWLDAKGRVWSMVEGRGILRHSSESPHEVDFSLNDIDEPALTRFRNGTDGSTWIRTRYENLYLVSDDGKVQDFGNVETELTSLPHVINGFVDARNRLWIYHPSEFTVVDPRRTGDLVSVPHTDMLVESNDQSGLERLLKLSDGRVLFTRGNTSAVIDPDAGTVTYLNISDAHDPQFAIAYEDSHGHIWIGSNTECFRLTERTYPVDRIYLGEDDADDDTISILGFTAVDDSTTIIQTRAGFFLSRSTDLAHDSWEDIETPSTDWFKLSPSGVLFDSPRIGSSVGPEGRIWFSVRTGEIGWFDIDAMRIVNVGYSVEGDLADYIVAFNAIEFDTNGRLVVGTEDGRLLRSKHSIDGLNLSQAIELQPVLTPEISSPVSVLHLDNGGQILIGTVESGLWSLAPAPSAVTKFSIDRQYDAFFGRVGIFHLLRDSSGILWVAGINYVVRYDEQTNDVFRIDRRGVASLIEDFVGNIWYTNSTRISRIAAGSRIRVDFDARTEGRVLFTIGGSRLFPDGRIAVPCFYSVFFIEPSQFKTNPAPSTVRTSNIFINGEDATYGSSQYLDEPFDPTRTLILPAGVESLSLKFTASGISDATQSQYRWKMEGLETQWHESSGRDRTASYTTLPHGNYTLRIQASNSQGIWNRNAYSLPVKVLPFWWQTIWAKGLYVASGLLVLLVVVQWRTYALRTRGVELEVQVRDKTREVRESLSIAEHASESKGKFLASLSHELRTPLTSIIGFSHLLKEKKVKENLQEEYGGIINSTGNHLLELINGVLDYSKIEAGQTKLDLRASDLREVVDNVRLIFVMKSEQAGVRLTVFVSEIVPNQVLCDDRKVKQILINLVGNALKFTESGSVELAVEMEETGDGIKTVIAKVTDTGKGIPPDDVPHIFDEFRQVRGTHAEEKGTGLGLAISYGFARIMGGDLTVESELGKGSAFELTFPIQSVSGASEEVRAVDESLLRTDPPLNVLVVDDLEANRALLEALIVRLGHRVTTARDGFEALHEFSEQSPDLILLDLEMPNLDGNNVIKELRQMEHGSETKLVIVSASDSDEVQRKVLDLGANAFLAKPYDMNQLYSTLLPLITLQGDESKEVSTSGSD